MPRSSSAYSEHSSLLLALPRPLPSQRRIKRSPCSCRSSLGPNMTDPNHRKPNRSQDSECETETPQQPKTRRERWLQACFEARLSTVSALDEIACHNGAPSGKAIFNDYVVPGLLLSFAGSISQFDVRSQRSEVLPPLAGDCCETFCVLTALCIVSLVDSSEFVKFFLSQRRDSSGTGSAVNYFVYFAAWLHQLTAPQWGYGLGKLRPNVADVVRCLGLREMVQSVRLAPEEFTPIFYYEREKVVSMLAQLRRVESRKRKREATGECSSTLPQSPAPLPVRGFIIVSGDFTFAVASIPRTSSCNDLLLLDSHGVLPWADGRACVCGFTDAPIHPEIRESISDPELKSFDSGFEHFVHMVLAVLDFSRQLAAVVAPISAVRPQQQPSSHSPIVIDLDGEDDPPKKRKSDPLLRSPKRPTLRSQKPTNSVGKGAYPSPPSMTWVPIFQVRAEGVTGARPVTSPEQGKGGKTRRGYTAFELVCVLEAIRKRVCDQQRDQVAIFPHLKAHQGIQPCWLSLEEKS
jgi:hypothetical protein